MVIYLRHFIFRLWCRWPKLVLFTWMLNQRAHLLSLPQVKQSNGFVCAARCQGPFLRHCDRLHTPAVGVVSETLLQHVTILQNILYIEGRKEGNVLFNNTLNTFYLWLYGVRHMVKETQIARGNLLPPHGQLFPISSKGSLICIIPQTG